MNFIKRYSSFPKSVQDFLRESDVNKCDDYIKEIDPDCKCTHDGFTILMMICTYNGFHKEDYHPLHIPLAFEKIEWLLEQNANPNTQNKDGYTALMFAAVESSPERGMSSEKTVKILLAAKADPNIQNKHGGTALMYAARNSSPHRGTSSENTVKMLLDAGADPNKQDIDGGWTALMAAARNSSPKRGDSSERTVELLLAAGANPNTQEETGWTALMLAARESSPERGDSSEKTVELLLVAGADPNIRCEAGKTVKDYASENIKHIFAKKWKIPQLINNGKTIKDIVCHICDDNNKDVVLTCGHTFCFECFKKFSESQKCPNCREAFAENDVKQFIL